MTQTQIDAAFAAMGLAPPSSALLASLEAIPDTYTALATIIQLPQVQTSVIPIVTMFDLALGHDPTAATLTSIVQTNLSQAALASAFVSSQAFGNVYNGGAMLNPNTIITSANDSIITALFVNGLGHTPTQATLNGFHGLTLATAFLDFSQSQAAGVSPIVDGSLTQILELATGIPAQAVTPPTQSFTLTNGQDSVISGQNTVGTTAPGTLVIQSTAASPENTVINAPLSGPFGNQPSLTSGDDINLAASVDGANSLIAGFDGSDNVTGLTIQGVQTWTINQAGGGSVFIEGAPGKIDGLTSLTFNGNGLNAENLQVGIAGAGIDATTPADGFALNISNVASNPVTGIVTVFFAAGSFHGGDAINVNANAVTNTQGGTTTSSGAALFVNAGSGGAAGFATWNVSSTNANSINDIALGTLSSTAARTINITDDGSSTIIWNDAGGAEWAQLTTVDAAGTSGALTVTGGENGFFGLLSGDTTALTLVEGGSGADLFDLSAYAGSVAQVAGLSILGGANTTIELSNNEVNVVSGVASGAFANWLNVAVLDVVASVSPAVPFGGVGVGGTINMADFPGTLTVSLLSSTSHLDPDQLANIKVTNAPDGLNFDFNSTDQHGFNFSVTGTDTAGGAANVVNVNYGSFANFDSVGSFSSSNFDHVNINLTGAEAFPILENFYFGGLTAVANADAGETLTINASLTHAGGETVWVGNVTTQHLGVDDITLLGGGITVAPPLAHFNLTGTLDITGTDAVDIGITNASTVHSTTAGAFQMWSPDDFVDLAPTPLWLSGTGVTVDSASAGSILQGSLGAGFVAGNDSLTDIHGGTTFMGDAGVDVLNLGDGGNNVVFGEGLLNDNGLRVDVTNGADHAAGGWWGVANSVGQFSGSAIAASSSADMSTINGFAMTGGGHDVLTFNADAWAGGSDAGGGLVTGTGFAIPPVGNSVMQLLGAGGTVNGATDVVLYTEGGLTNAADLAADLSGAGAIHFGLGAAITAGNHMLFAYDSGGDIHIADVDFVNGLTGFPFGESTAGRTIVASDIADIAGGNNGSTTSLAILGANPADVHFIHI
jgi:hypothetical protein